MIQQETSTNNTRMDDNKPVEIGWGDVRWMRTVRGDMFPYPPTYEVCTRNGQVYEMTYADYVGLMNAIDADDQLVRRSWIATNFESAYMIYNRAEDVVPSTVSPAPRRNPITGHFLGGDRGAR